jgi:hypothetical protein
MFGWILRRLIRIRMRGAYDENDNLVCVVHVDARPAVFLLKIMTGLVKGVS